LRRRAGRLVAVAESLRELSDSLGTAPPRTLSWVFEHWPEVAGDTISRHAKPDRIEDRTLFVSADSPAWASRLKTVAPRVLEQIASVAGERAPLRLSVRVRVPK
jgi:predicted nucleic acid-binding Zn ribbon protein